MTELEWLSSDDPIAMIRWFRQDWRGKTDELDRVIQCYLLGCCRAIWPLLPMEASRHGVEAAYRYIEGRLSRRELGLAEYQAEGAALFLEPDFDELPEDERNSDLIRSVMESLRRKRESEPIEWQESWRIYEADRKAQIAQMVQAVDAIPFAEIQRMIPSIKNGPKISTQQLLSKAAFFADTAMCYPWLRPLNTALDRHRPFLSVPLLRKHLGNPFRHREPRLWPRGFGPRRG